MMKNDLYRQSLMPSHEIYLPYVLSVCYKASRLVRNTETVKWQSFYGTCQFLLRHLLLAKPLIFFGYPLGQYLKDSFQMLIC